MHHHHANARSPRRGCCLSMLAIGIVIGTPATPVHAQDEAYEAWTRVFDAIQPGWRGTIPPEAEAPLSEEDINVLHDYATGVVRTPTAREKAAFERLELVAPLLVEASGHRQFDPGTDWSNGFSAVLPHLSVMRLSARCMQALSHRATAEGRPEEAVAWTGRIAGAAGQVSQDGSLIGSLVGGAIYALADGELDRLSGAGMLDAEAAQAALDGLSWLGEAADPFQVMNAMTLEKEIMAFEMNRIADGLDAGDDEILEQVLMVISPDDIDASGISADEVRAQAEIMFDLQTRMIDAAADPDRQRGLETMREIEAEIADPETPSLVSALMPGMGRVLEMRLRLENSMNDRMRLLEAIASGRVSPKDAMNAAILWERLGTLFETLPGPVQVAGLEVVDEAPTAERLKLLVERAVGDAADDLRTELERASASTTDPLLAWWTGTVEVEAEIRDLAAIASAVTAADFPATGGLVERYRVRSHDLARLRGAGRGLVIDATARLRLAATPPPAGDDAATLGCDPAFERTAAADEIVAVLALVHDLLADPALAHVVLASDLVTSVDRLLRADEAAPMLEDAATRDRIARALNAIPRATTLGSAAAAAADLDLFVDARKHQLDDGERTRLRRRLSRLGTDRAYAFLLADSGLAVRPAQPATGEPPTPITPWADPEGYETGYRPLRLIATMEGVHGADQVLVEDGSLEPAVTDAFRDDPTRPRLDRLVPIERFDLDFTAGEALVRISDLDDLLLEIGRASRPGDDPAPSEPSR